MDCRQAAHADAVQCVKNQDMELVQRLAAEEGWRRCHRCHTMIEHRTACRHITCRCGAEFCSTLFLLFRAQKFPHECFLKCYPKRASLANHILILLLRQTSERSDLKTY